MTAVDYNTLNKRRLRLYSQKFKNEFIGFPGGVGYGNLPANAGDAGLIPHPGRFHMPRTNPACSHSN